MNWNFHVSVIFRIDNFNDTTNYNTGFVIINDFSKSNSSLLK